LSLSISSARKRRKGKHIPRWVTEHEQFNKELAEEFKVRCEDFLRCAQRQPDPSERLGIFKESVHVTASYIRRICKDLEANTTEHKLAVCMSFIRAIYTGRFDEAGLLQKRCDVLTSVRIDNNTWFSDEFMAVKTQVVELMQEDIRERTEELRQVKNNLPEYDIERRRRGIANKLKKMLPGGVSEISAMSDDSGEIVTAPEDIAGCLNNHWQRILDKRHTDPIKRMEWLEEVRNKLRVSKEQLRPT